MFAPFLVFAQSFGAIIGTIQGLVTSLLPLFMGIATLVFFYGVIKYITAGGDPGKREEARNTIIYGIIGLFAIMAVWGLVGLLANLLGVTIGGTILAPSFPS